MKNRAPESGSQEEGAGIPEFFPIFGTPSTARALSDEQRRSLNILRDAHHSLIVIEKNRERSLVERLISTISGITVKIVDKQIRKVS
jgi:hypothetical protein